MCLLHNTLCLACCKQDVGKPVWTRESRCELRNSTDPPSLPRKNLCRFAHPCPSWPKTSSSGCCLMDSQSPPSPCAQPSPAAFSSPSQPRCNGTAGTLSPRASHPPTLTRCAMPLLKANALCVPLLKTIALRTRKKPRTRKSAHIPTAAKRTKRSTTAERARPRPAAQR